MAYATLSSVVFIIMIVTVISCSAIVDAPSTVARGDQALSGSPARGRLHLATYIAVRGWIAAEPRGCSRPDFLVYLCSSWCCCGTLVLTVRGGSNCGHSNEPHRGLTPFILVLMALLLIGVIGFLRHAGGCLALQLIADHNYDWSSASGGLGRDLTRVMGIPTLAGASRSARAGDHGARRLRTRGIVLVAIQQLAGRAGWVYPSRSLLMLVEAQFSCVRRRSRCCPLTRPHGFAAAPGRRACSRGGGPAARPAAPGPVPARIATTRSRSPRPHAAC